MNFIDDYSKYNHVSEITSYFELEGRKLDNLQYDSLENILFVNHITNI
jgi:hypothetical protein